ncbi:peptidylprolyl isomerase [Sarracenia purpurea var. burkii]
MATELYGAYEIVPIDRRTSRFVANTGQLTPFSISLSLSFLPQLSNSANQANRTSQVTENLEVMSDAIDLTGDGGVIKTLVKRAKPNAIVPSDDLPLLDVHYEGILAENGEVFDTTHEDNTVFTFELGAGSVIKGWDVALRTMKVGEIAKLTLKPEYAYGSAGSPPDIPPDATLIFEIELVACRPRKGSSLNSVSDERARLEELKKQREIAAALKEEEKKKRGEAKAAAAARIQAKLESKKGQGKGKGKAK